MDVGIMFYFYGALGDHALPWRFYPNGCLCSQFYGFIMLCAELTTTLSIKNKRQIYCEPQVGVIS
jgi:hypothetical protein